METVETPRHLPLVREPIIELPPFFTSHAHEQQCSQSWPFIGVSQGELNEDKISSEMAQSISSSI